MWEPPSPCPHERLKDLVSQELKRHVPFCSPLLLALHRQVNEDPSGKRGLEWNTIKEPFIRNLLQKDQVANYYRKRKNIDACRGRNDRLMEDCEIFTNNDLQISEETQIFFGILTRRRRIVNPASVNLKDLNLKFIDLWWTKVMNLRRLCCRRIARDIRHESVNLP